jgi:uncharacterized protein
MRLIPRAEYRAMPWKNGRGATTEIYAHPLDTPNFDWRVSIAAVSDDGPFSSFAGYERHIMLLSGNGMKLEIAGREAVVLRPHQPFSFSGDADVTARLTDGPVVDFNLIVRRDFGSGQLRLQTGQETGEFGNDRGCLLIHAIDGDSLYLDAGERGQFKHASYLAICEVTPVLRSGRAP